MSISTVFFLILGLIVLVAVVRLVRNLKLREKYAALWLFLGLITVVLMLFPRLLDRLASWVGVATPVNLLFLIAILLLLGICLHLSLEISRLEDETRVLAEESAIQRSLLIRELERTGQRRNPTASLPIIHPDDVPRPDIAEAGAARGGASGRPGRTGAGPTETPDTDTPEKP
ncbi:MULTISPECIES: DUF2304 domain-containing protein [Rothia]|uniref:DUF2304 domain-containing protein n=1 Tax=Rothia TaxID=32207 RepID=UPI0007E6CBE3|nr:DUF2304 domain-containing protein [Rothia kristinae]TDP52391.1 hypothetical protein DEU33_1971 [Kocuria sp. AG109]MCA1170799.1 DUF2304 domain-containing protein [Rothia kristinae]MCT1358180.1 DUF2304 domain-containing protein [Rothia kristinae]MCT1394033.1 DUF2304 domain-containing protein [Rothia kristinae]MCT1505795.1 DUF2304 domain-containing protein [Rothia kristinae]